MLKRLTIGSIAALSLLLGSTSPAAASVTIGGLAPGSPPASNCSNVRDDWVQPAVVTGNPYEIPSTGAITSWSTNASPTVGQVWTMKIFRHISGSTYRVLAHDGPRTLTAGTLNTFATNIPVKAGDLLGMNDADTTTPVNTTCAYVSTGDTIYFNGGSLADNQEGPIATAIANRRLNIQAVFEPANNFTVVTVTRDRKAGTATITVDVPNAGELVASGPGVIAASAQAVTSKAVPLGQSQLVVGATGRKKRKLRRKGRAKINVAVTYTPTDGAARTQHVKLKLRRKPIKPRR